MAHKLISVVLATSMLAGLASILVGLWRLEPLLGAGATAFLLAVAVEKYRGG